MASRSAGTLITHNNATYKPPALMPGYRGYVPIAKFTYGDTYGNTTLKSFQDFRSQALNTSQSPYSTGGHYPTMYSHDPSLVIASRSRDRDRMLLAPYMSKNSMDSDRQQELTQFEKMAQKHRVSYNDKTGTVQPVKYFILPTSEGEGFPQRQDMYLGSQ
ncbi:protein FAM166C A isoform X2 [Polyodon spathula]|uniref:protein FAM166C A isoform X2 n=1 Tax=Polyodon spathula TaxID=7913 RepID=UPI001B7F3EAD|nr:protein FAM166C A isoform X2 [Polyodon spathula]